MTLFGGRLDPSQLPNGVVSGEIIATDGSTNANVAVDGPFSLVINAPSPPFQAQADVRFESPPPAHETIIFVRDAQFRRCAQLDGWSNLTYIIRHQAVGSFTLDVNPYNSGGTRYEAAQLLLARGGGIIIVRDGSVVFSGPVGHHKRSRDNTGKMLVEVAGFDDMVWLARRQIKQEPGNPAPPYNTNAYDTETNPASTVMRHFVGANLGSGATPERQLAALTLADDPVLGDTVKWQGRLGTQLLAALVGLARPANLAFRITQDEDTNTLVFAVTATVDRTRQVVFADTLGNISDWAHEHTAANANYLYVLGEGNGTARTVVEVSDTGSIIEWGRAEAAYDQRSQPDETLGKAGTAQLEQTADTVSLTFTAVQTGGHVWPDDWGIGDAVSAIFDDIELDDLIREIRVDLTPDGETITPIIGSAAATTKSLARRETKAMADRISVLEGV